MERANDPAPIASRGSRLTERATTGASAGQTINTVPQAGGGLLPSLTLPKGGGAIRGIGETFSTNPATGTMSLAIPIATSPGRAGFELSLGLAYDSGRGNGVFGLGWGLSTPAVTRKTDRGLPRYLGDSKSDTFILSGAEDLVPARVPDDAGTKLDAFDQSVNGQAYRVLRFRPRVEGLFARIERWTHIASGEIHWRATSRENVTNIYGTSAQARVVDPRDASRVFSWLLEETRDDRGNVARYTYKSEDGVGVSPARLSETSRFDVQPDGTSKFQATAQRYLKRIEYGNSRPFDASDWLFEVVFDYGEHDAAVPTPDEEHPWAARLDPFSSYRSGFEVRTHRLCRRVLMFHRFDELGPTPCLVRSTDFTYDESPVTTHLTSAVQAGYVRDEAAGNYGRAALPPLELEYSRPVLNYKAERIDANSLVGAPGGVGHGPTQWVDLDGEGLPGVLETTPRGWTFKANLGKGKFAAPAPLRSLPVPAEVGAGMQKLNDLTGDGQLDLVQYTRPLQGYFTRTKDRDWEPFKAFSKLPNIDWNDPNLRFIDLDGDGHADLLISEHEVFTWYRSLAEEGFARAETVRKPREERDGPAVVFADGTETIHLADMSGDGLVDIVRVRSGEICYWPNLGFARFGGKRTLENSPAFTAFEQYDPGLIRFADIDGSGTTDILYLGHDGVSIYFNQSGNALSDPSVVRSLPDTDTQSSIEVVDFLGQGTACLVWSSPLPPGSSRPVLYVDLLGGQKPHLLSSVKNNLGSETRIAYLPSTHYYLRDKAEGRPWLTRLPFPVQVVERVERVDHVAKSKLTTTFRYHHGFFNGHEREFGGFACVEQMDAESIGGERGKGLFPELPYDLDVNDEDLNLPPVRTVKWFHTGAWLESTRLEIELAKEYYNLDPDAPLLPDTTLPSGLSEREERESARALRGSMLRQEIYAEDKTPQSIHPYTVSEQSHTTRLIQEADTDQHAVVFVHPNESVELHYERNPTDPRIQHEIVLEVDDYGGVTRSVELAYPRRTPAQPEQASLWATLTETIVANRATEPDWYRVGVAVESRTTELTGLAELMPAPNELLTGAEVRAAIASATTLAYEDTADGLNLEKRVVERQRTVYYRNDLSGALPLGQVDSLALLFESYRMALTPGLVTQVYGTKVSATELQDDWKYALQDGAWWAPTGRAEYDPAQFYMPVRSIDPFGESYTAKYDSHALLSVEVRDPLDNVITVENDYRVLAPSFQTDPNENQTAIEFDALGMVVKTAVMGKGDGEGDTLADPTTRTEYDLSQFQVHGKPVFVHTFAREQHGAANPRWQETYTYSDGSGREVMEKVQAESGPVPILGADGLLVRNADGTAQLRNVASRWVGTGRTVFDNKGNPVKRYEPFFSETFEFEQEKDLVEWGVTPILRYDPTNRLVRTDLPNGTHTRVVFDAWSQEEWDENDTVSGTPWLAAMQAGSPEQKRAATLALLHDSTPAVSHLDSLGRTFLAIADNGSSAQYETRFTLDVESNKCSITDARGVQVVKETFDLLNRRIDSDSADAGRTSTLHDATGKRALEWGAQGHRLRTLYDGLQRPTHHFVRRGGATEILVERSVYGEAHPAAEQRNLRGQLFGQFDGAGVEVNERYDFKGNVVKMVRYLAKHYRETMDWNPVATQTSFAEIAAATLPLLEADSYSTTTIFDALDRAISQTTADGSETETTYNEANFTDSVGVRVRDAALWTKIVEDIDYNARGQRTNVKLGNGTSTTYEYDAQTFLLVRQRTTRNSDNLVLQDLAYTHDPVGNIVETRNAAPFGNSVISADGLYEYDSLYRLTQAEGREHPGQQPNGGDPLLLRTDHPNDMHALRRYRESYSYDETGNILRMEHKPILPGGSTWVRVYEYATDSNHLLLTNAPGAAAGLLADSYSYDSAGNLVRMPHLPEMRWDYINRLAATSKQVVNAGTPETTYYTYDSNGQRVRKVTERQAVAGESAKRKAEQIYLHGGEFFREYEADGIQSSLVRETLHVMDGEHTAVLVETKIKDVSAPAFAVSTRLRYQVADNLGSTSMELSEIAGVITYEEYSPYGCTSFHATNSTVDLGAKRYRYTGKERDSETGLYYHQARYYASWLGRWTSPDPSGHGDDLNRYGFVGANPINYRDPSGNERVNGFSGSQSSSDVKHNRTRFLNLFQTQNSRFNAAETLARSFEDPGFRDIGSISDKAESRFFSVLALSADSSIAPTHFHDALDKIRDTGFRTEFQDPHPSSSRQVGHFLTAAHMGYQNEQFRKGIQEHRQRLSNSTIYLLLNANSNLEMTYGLNISVNLRAAIGHELVADDAGSKWWGGSLVNQLITPTPAQISAFENDKLNQIKLNTSQDGNSYQDLYLTRVGFLFGERMAQGAFKNSGEAGQWLRLMLTPTDLSKVPKTSGFYQDAQRVNRLLQQYKQLRPAAAGTPTP